MVRVKKSNSSAPKIPSIEIHEPREQNETIWRTKMHRIAIEFASTFIGQAIMMQFDKLLWTLEKTATWISSGKSDSKKPVNLIRPLPWIFFLPTLVALRYTRVILSLLSICLGYDEIEVYTMVTWLHQSRRTIRHIVQEANQNEQLKAAQNHNNTSIDCVKRIILSLLSNLSSLIFSTPHTISMHNNKTSLNSSTIDESKQQQKIQNDDGIPSNNGSNENSDDEVSEEDQAYQDFLSRTIESSDADDEDFVHDVNGGDISSDMNSQSSIATEDLSNDEIDINRSIEAETGTATEALDGVSHTNVDDTSVAINRTEKGCSEADTDATRNVQTDNALNQLIDDTTTVMGNKSVTRQNRGGKNNNKRYHKNGGGASGGRSHAKAQNNGKHFNGASTVQGESKAAATAATTNHHVDTFREFTVTEADAAADHTQTH